LAQHRLILLSAQKNAQEDTPKEDGIYKMSTVGIIMRMLKLPDGRLRILVQGMMRARIESLNLSESFITAKLTPIREPEVKKTNIKSEALVRNVKKAMETASDLGKNIAPEIMIIISNMEDPGRLADLVATNLDLRVKSAQEILSLVIFRTARCSMMRSLIFSRS